MMRVNLDHAHYNDDDRLTWKGQLFTGVAVEVGDDGLLMAESTYRDGVQDGPARVFRPDGSVQMEENYHFGIAVEIREWHRNGQLAYELRNDEFGHKLSERRWNEDGSPQS